VSFLEYTPFDLLLTKAFKKTNIGTCNPKNRKNISLDREKKKKTYSF